MRTLMTLTTLVAAGVGYVYLQVPPPIGEPYYSNRAVASFPWTMASFGVNSSSRPPVKDFVKQVHQRTRSVLDDFTSQRADQAPAVVDNAFERLRKVTQSALSSSSGAADSSGADLADNTRPSAVPMPDFDELQRTAFEATEVEESKLTQAGRVELADSRVDQPDSTIHELTPEAAVEAPPQIIQKSEPVIAPKQQEITTIETAASTAVIRPSANVVASELPKRTPTTMVSNKVTKSVTGEWKVVGTSTEGRPIHTMHLGESGTRTFVIAGLNGDDRTGVRWLELLSEELRRRPELLQNNEVVFFRAGNPDGLVRNARNNARGVPLNRNFPSRRYRPTADMPPFAVPAGEVETRVILETLYSFRPRRVIHLGATTGQSQVLYNRAAKNIGTEFERATKLNAQIFDSEQFPGSLEDFADGTLEASVMSIRLSVENDWKQAWSKLQLPVLSAVIGQPIDPTGQGKDQPTDPDRTLIPTMTNESSSRNPRRRGYEELPPPPLR